ncbi:MAG: hydroxysqualene dehydroxylase HpnE [Methylophilaceae bacterium]|nr:hydroxysqualene dehydroxylase HpnE [Methylophilaceae bacterium]
MKDLRVAIIGAGWAGLSAAVELAARGVAVTVFEAAPNLGGRARGIARNGLTLDNGQHLLLGAYRETLRLMAVVGVDTHRVLLRLPLRLEIPGHLRLSAPALPAPLHLLTGLLVADGLGWSERWAAVRFMIRQRLTGFRLARDESVAALLADQPEKLVRLLWEPLCLAALNTPIATASAQVFLNVLRDSFNRTRIDSDLIFPRVDLTTLFPQQAAAFIASHGGAVRPATMVAALEPALDGVLVNGECYTHAICAVAPFALPRLLGRMPEMADTLNRVGKLGWQPIATIYLQYPETVRLPFPLLGLQKELAQWVLDRGTLCGQRGLLAAVISAEGPHLRLDHATLASRVHHALRRMLGSLPDPLWQQVIVEKRATFACTASIERPLHVTGHRRIFLAGDYTAGDYPATLEGAVRSGVQCANLIYSATR